MSDRVHARSGPFPLLHTETYNFEHNFLQHLLFFKSEFSIDRHGKASIDCVYNQMNWTILRKDILKTVKKSQIFTVLRTTFLTVIQFTLLYTQSIDLAMPDQLCIQTCKTYNAEEVVLETVIYL